MIISPDEISASWWCAAFLIAIAFILLLLLYNTIRFFMYHKKIRSILSYIVPIKTGEVTMRLQDALKSDAEGDKAKLIPFIVGIPDPEHDPLIGYIQIHNPNYRNQSTEVFLIFTDSVEYVFEFNGAIYAQSEFVKMVNEIRIHMEKWTQPQPIKAHAKTANA